MSRPPETETVSSTGASDADPTESVGATGAGPGGGGQVASPEGGVDADAGADRADRAVSPEGMRPAAAGSVGNDGVAEAGGAGASAMDVVPRRARWFVAFLLLALAVPGVIGFEAWPLTGWRLFSLARDDSQTAWVLDAVDGRGETHVVELEQLPLRYRHAEWPMAELPGASTVRQEAVCQALLGAVVDLEPSTVALNITRDRQHMVERDGEWTVTHDPEVIHTCRISGEGAR